jgi:hypothetical protein
MISMVECNCHSFSYLAFYRQKTSWARRSKWTLGRGPRKGTEAMDANPTDRRQPAGTPPNPLHVPSSSHLEDMRLFFSHLETQTTDSSFGAGKGKPGNVFPVKIILMHDCFLEPSCGST